MKRFNLPVEEIIMKRKSVRTYSGQAILEEVKYKIKEYMNALSNPFQTEVTFKLLESDVSANSAKLGTYGVIKGTKDYFGATVKEGANDLEALGYEFEHLVLYLTSLGLGTCWLGGTFNRSEFTKAMSVKEDQLFPAISPFGYPADKKSMTDSLFRFVSKGDSRKPWRELFFNRDFSTPLSATEAGIYEVPLEMVRLGPSASNKQPWRIIKDHNRFHFYEYKTPGYSKAFSYDIQRLDMGIAACHFHLSAMERELKGEFKKLPDPIKDVPEDTVYRYSWVAQ